MAPVKTHKNNQTESHWYSRPINEVADAYASSSTGLDDAEAVRRLSEYGYNRLPERNRAGPVLRFLRQFHNLLIYVLIAAAVVTGALGHWVDMGVISSVVFINAVIGFVQE